MTWMQNVDRVVGCTRTAAPRPFARPAVGELFRSRRTRTDAPHGATPIPARTSSDAGTDPPRPAIIATPAPA
jgi:hypothetical protein